MASVRLEELGRRFAGAIAIEDITFSIPDGQFWVLVGPSGCGKSTILRTIAGLETATTGNLYIGDRLVNQVPARQRDVAMVFQNYALYPHMSVAENLAFGLQMRQSDPRHLKERVARVAKMLEIEHLLERKPRQLSGGQQQRVALGRAIARQPQVFLLDEPLSNLDAQLRDDTRAELKQLHQQVGITTVYVTHDQIEAMTLADQIVVLNHGRIQQIGTPQMIYRQPNNRMVATFLGNPAMNILQATYNGATFQVNGQSMPCPEALQAKLPISSGQCVDVGIRPEHIRVSSEHSHLSAIARLVEPLGRETLVRAEISPAGTSRAQVLTIQVPSEDAVQLGDSLPISFDLSQVLVFDPATGRRLDDF